MNCYRYFVAGRVQKVGFRNFVWRKAKRLGVSGFTKNLPDGRVEVLASFVSGEGRDAFEKALRKGPVFARVDEVKKNKEDEYAKKGFDILVD